MAGFLLYPEFQLCPSSMESFTWVSDGFLRGFGAKIFFPRMPVLRPPAGPQWGIFEEPNFIKACLIPSERPGIHPLLTIPWDWALHVGHTGHTNSGTALRGHLEPPAPTAFMSGPGLESTEPTIWALVYSTFEKAELLAASQLQITKCHEPSPVNGCSKRLIVSH